MFSIPQDYAGFGETEFFYSLVVSAFFFSSIITSPIVGFLILCIPFFFLLLSGTIILIISNLLYGLATQAWMLILSRFLLGVAFQIFNMGFLSYIGIKESDYVAAYIEHRSRTKEEKVDHTSPPKVEIKKTMLLIYTIIAFVPAIIGPGI